MTEKQALQSLLNEVERKLWLAQTSAAFAKGTNQDTIELREKQIAALKRVLEGQK